MDTTKIKNSECVWSWKLKNRIKILRGPLVVGVVQWPKCRHLHLSDCHWICTLDKEAPLSTSSLQVVDKQMLIMKGLFMISLARLAVCCERIN